MNKLELIKAVAEDTGQTQAGVTSVVESVIRQIEASLARSESVKIQNFGVFQVKHREAYQGRNPQTGEPKTIPACDVPGFRASKKLKELVNE